ncbi:zinc finger BED domain-containing protein 4-like [Temnothorax longispinosus]
MIKTKGNTTNLRFHLTRTHPKVLLQMKRATETSDVTEASTSPKQRKVMPQDETDQDIDDDFDIMAKSVSPPNSSESPVLSVTSNISRSEASVVSLPVLKKRQYGGIKAAEYTNKLIFMIAKDNLPFATVEKEGFLTFMKTVAPLYKIPSRKKITSLIEEKYEFLSDEKAELFGTEKHLSCFAHTLNLVPSIIIKEDIIVRNFCKKIKTIVTYFKHSVVAADELRAHSAFKLIQSVETRWNSTYDMLVRFIELADKINGILLQQPTAPIMLTASELQAAKEFVDLLKPFNEATRIICGEHYLTGSKVIPIIHTLKNKLDMLTPKTEIGVHFKCELERQFSNRFSNIENVYPLVISTILDPRFKNLHFSDKIAYAHCVNKITQIININANESDICDFQNAQQNNLIQSDNFWTLHENLVAKYKHTLKNNDFTMVNELQYYLNQPPMKMDGNPLKYWLINMHSDLKNIALKYLTIIATSVPSERLFSRAGNIVTESRNRITGKHLQQMLFLNSLSVEDWLL